ncbi:MAG: DNA-binding protein [Kofleriaceae bacterium]
MPEKATIKRANNKLRRGDRPSTAAGEFVREEMHHIRRGKHGARSPEQAIAIGLSKARRAGVPLRPPAKGKTSRRTRRSAGRAYKAGQAGSRRKPSRRRSAAISDVLRREPRRAASRGALSRHARRAARRRTAADRSRAARHAVATKGTRGRRAAARKAARTRKRNAR